MRCALHAHLVWPGEYLCLTAHIETCESAAGRLPEDYGLHKGSPSRTTSYEASGISLDQDCKDYQSRLSLQPSCEGIVPVSDVFGPLVFVRQRPCLEERFSSL